MALVDRDSFDAMLIDGPAEPRLRKHRGPAKRAVDAILSVLPSSGNIGELGNPEEAIKTLQQRIDDKQDVQFISPLMIAIIEAMLEFLIQWWFNNKSHATGVLARLCQERDGAANGKSED